MALYHIIILSLIQGLTEFLPVSSSGHLVLYHDLTGSDETDTAARWTEDLTLDVAVHVGTLFSVLLYFRRDLAEMIASNLPFGAKTKKSGPNMALFVILASIPVILAGFALYMWKPEWLRSLEIMGWATVIFGIALWLADRFKPQDKTLDALTLKGAFLIGLAQMLALIPGTSRSGITMTAARVMGYTRTDAAKFSLFLSIIAIAGAGVIGALQLYQNGSVMLGMDVLIALALSFISGWIAIAVMMRWLERFSFTPFAIYRVILGGALLGLFYGGVIG